VGTVHDLIARNRSQSGRITDLEVIGAKGRTRVVGAARVREVLGTPSAKLDMQKTRASFVATGWGYGDGVGLSQHGALGMAWAGFRYDEILAHYYRGVELAQDYGRGSSRPLREAPAGRRSRVAERSR
jgi:stage II sporulation protein D